MGGKKKFVSTNVKLRELFAVGSDSVCRSQRWGLEWGVLFIIPQGAHGKRLWISPYPSILRFLLLYCFWCFFSISFSCTGNVNVSQVVIPTGDEVEKLLSVMWKRNAELLNLLHVVEKVRRDDDDDDDDAGDGNIVVLQKSINNDDVDNVLVSQLLIKATYFLYGFNYLFCDVELCDLCGCWI